MNNYSLEYIDDYFNGKLSEIDKRKFELDCNNDNDFAEQVSFYIATRAAARQQLIIEKKKRFDNLYQTMPAAPSKAVHIRLLPFIISAVAACLLFVFCWYMFLIPPGAERLATNYINSDLENLSVTMSGDSDTLQLGVEAYNKQNYGMAEKYFKSLVDNDNYTSEALKHLGLTYLKTDQLDKAIPQFNRLSSIKNLYANAGPFYKAVTLMKRSQGDDVAQAKELLERVVKSDMPGKKQAEEWLGKM